MNAEEKLATFVPPLWGGRFRLERIPRGAFRFPRAIFDPSLREEMCRFGCMGRDQESVLQSEFVPAIALKQGTDRYCGFAGICLDFGAKSVNFSRLFLM